jgi:hypothetical protein
MLRVVHPHVCLLQVVNAAGKKKWTCDMAVGWRDVRSLG